MTTPATLRRIAVIAAAAAPLAVISCAGAPDPIVEAAFEPARASTATPHPLGVSTAALVSADPAGEFTAPANPTFHIQREILARTAELRPDAPGMGESGNVTQISFAPEGADFDPNVSRDGRTIVFASTQHRPTADIYIKNVEGRTVTQLTNDPANDLMPRLSPDGTRIAFASDRLGVWDIYVMPATGGKPIQITSSSAHELHPSWSPDGKEIVFCRLGEVSGMWEMWVTSVSSPGVARSLGNGLFPEWCPVGGTGAGGADRIAFQKSRERGDRSFGIWVIDYKDGQAGNSTELACAPNAACINPAWSPDGRWIAYATVPNASQWWAEARPAWAELWMVDAEGNNRVALTGGRFVNLMPAWGPRNQIYFVSDRGGIENIWAMDTGKVMALAAANTRGNTAVATSAPKASPRPAPTVANAPETSSP